MLPNFLGIGAPRCGTTWLHKLLEAHPDVFVPQIKEVHFFDRHLDKGIDWYANHFDKVSDSTAVGEITPAYLYAEDAATRIKEYLGDIRLIVILRNPAQRAFSHYLNMIAHQRQAGRKQDRSFQEMTQLEPRIIEEGFYCKLLRPYLSLFSRNNFLILFHDDVLQQPEAVWQEVCDYLAIDSGLIAPQQLQAKVNTSRGRNGKYAAVYRLVRLLQRFGLFTAAERLEILNQRNLPVMDHALRQGLNQIYKEDIQQLERICNKDLSCWFS